MRRWIQGIAVFSAFMVIPITFTNCDVYSENSLFETYSKACGDETCQEYSSDYLEIRINSPQDVGIDANEIDFDLGGDCNDGGFADNAIVWELHGPDGMVTNSFVEGHDYRCENGRFSVFLQLPQGLSNGSARVEHQLVIEIIGLSEDGADVFKNPLVGRATVNLFPL